MRGLSQEQIAVLKEQGYLPLSRLLDPAVTQPLI